MDEVLFSCAGVEGKGPLQCAELPHFLPGIQITEMMLLGRDSCEDAKDSCVSHVE